MRWLGLFRGFWGMSLRPSEDSFENGLLDCPHYTRPEVFEGKWQCPPVLLSGNHQEIAKWRRKQALEKTQECGPIC